MKLRFFLIFFSAFGLYGCSSEFTKTDLKTETSEDRRISDAGKFLGDDTLHFGGPQKREQEDTGLGVNSHLWRATLDTISFMPIASADPFGGVIITDWYSPPQSPQERLKMNIFILDRQLRSDGVRVSIFRQERDQSGQWIDQPVNTQTVQDLENAILVRARHFRSKTIKP
ncbi:MAG: DUF3576 domain-containing protein [Alphaproteobacteria bacterium]|jgi:hypothetical protein|nr:DUF3576 domain-containing protein [Alphaproteobacteria bacterium]MBP7729587.1 DUF3576 domain-containing protein [Alphaproteobacteria bacterium]